MSPNLVPDSAQRPQSRVRQVVRIAVGAVLAGWGSLAILAWSLAASDDTRPFPVACPFLVAIGVWMLVLGSGRRLVAVKGPASQHPAAPPPQD